MEIRLLVDHVGVTNSLFAASAADLTIERIRALAADQIESLTLEFKREYSKSLVTAIAAMANTYGGMILVGVNDKAESGVDRVVGVNAQETIDKIASACSLMLDPPWEPAFFAIPFDDGSGRSVVAIRIDPDAAPRPLLIGLKAPIRLSGQNSWADRDRLLKLAREEPSARLLPMGQNVMAPQLGHNSDGSIGEDFVLRTGINLPMGEAGAWRPLSERSVSALAAVLTRSPLRAALEGLGHGSFSRSTAFRQLGHNRSRRARLVFQAISGSPVRHPVEAVVTVDLPTLHGPTSTGLMATVTVDVIARVRRYAESIEAEQGYRYPVPALVDLFDGLLRAFVDPAVVTEVARIADIDTALVSQPRELHLITDGHVRDLLSSEGLHVIPDAGASFGGTFRANPALDLRLPDERREQVDDWIRQLGLDAGLTGMEALVERYRDPTP
ncbi:AlbA family DNA-binding domain-containing protein [[Kitasatospora] papulosa]